MNRSVRRGRVWLGAALVVQGVVAAAGLGGGFAVLGHLGEAGVPGSGPPAGCAAPPDGSYTVPPLETGVLPPAFEAAGWVNGSPARPGGQSPRLIVLDTWASW